MNMCIFSGRITRDAETRYTQGGTAITTLSIAVESGSGDYKRTDFPELKIWKREKLAPHLTKGKAITVTCEMETERWEKDGQKRQAIRFVVRDLEFQQGTPKGQSNNGEAHNRQDNRQQPQDDLGPSFPSEAGGMNECPF